MTDASVTYMAEKLSRKNSILKYAAEYIAKMEDWRSIKFIFLLSWFDKWHFDFRLHMRNEWMSTNLKCK